MKFAYYIVASFLVAFSIKSMEKCTFNESSAELLALRIFCGVADSDDYFESCIGTLRSCTLVSKQWYKVMTDHANLIINRLANKLCVRCNTKVSPYSIRTVKELNEHESIETFQRVYCTDRCREHDPAFTQKTFQDEHVHLEVVKVGAAVWLYTQGARNWLVQNYGGEENYKTLLGKMVQYPYAFDFIPDLRKANEMCDRIANQEIDTLVDILQQVNIPDQVGRFLLNSLCGQENISQKESIDLILTEVLHGQSSDNFKRFLIRFAILKNPECVNQKAPGSVHQFWCDVIKSGKTPIMEEVFKVSGFRMCENCNMSPTRKAMEEGRASLVSYLLEPLWD